MLEIKQIRENLSQVKLALSKKGLSDSKLSSLDDALNLDDERKRTQFEADELKSQINKISKQIGDLYKSGKAQEANALKAEVMSLKEKHVTYDDRNEEIIQEIKKILLTIPNIPHESVPPGSKAEDNEVYQEHLDDLPTLPDDASAHWDLLEKYNLISFPYGVKMAGAGFPVYLGKGAQLERALINFFLDEAIAAGYHEVIPPYLVNHITAEGTGSLPDKEGQMYHVTADDLYLIPTAEVPVTNIHRGETLNESELPKKYCAFTPCFRREAGSYGKDVKGLNRVHQFNKVEIVQFAHPEKSYEVLEKMLAHVASILKKLKLPYRILRLCGGDMTFTSALTYDFEVFSAAQKKWLEVSSVSNFETYQSNRLDCKVKREDGSKQLVHTLNGSALALPRIMASILENYQTSDGIKIPEVLLPYLKFDKIS